MNFKPGDVVALKPTSRTLWAAEVGARAYVMRTSSTWLWLLWDRRSQPSPHSQANGWYQIEDFRLTDFLIQELPV